MTKFHDVFVPGGFPKHTYNPRSDLRLEKLLGEARQNLCKLVTVTGQTKSGKTVLTRSVFPREECVWVDGGTVAVEDDLWQVVLEQLDIFEATEVETGSGASASISGAGSADANFIIAKGSAEVGGEMGLQRSKARRQSRSVSPRVAALRGLGKTKLPIVIDDFHYLPKETQGAVVRALKQLIFDGLPVIIIAIPHRRYDALRVEKEMTGRIMPIDVPSWSEPELSFIPTMGFAMLSIDPGQATKSSFAQEAIGSPHLMQEFCRTLCRQGGMDEDPAKGKRLASIRPESVFREAAETIGRPIYDKLARGPRQRSDRMERSLKDGRKVDIYELVLFALAHLKPGLVSLEYEDLRAAIREVSASQIPQLHEVARVLKHMASIAASDQSSTSVIDFEEEDKKLHVTDPFFAFYLRWGNLGV